MIRKLIGTFLFGIFISHSFAQSEQKINYDIVEVTKETVANFGIPQIDASSAKYYKIDVDALKGQLVGIMHREVANSGFVANVEFPHPDGTLHTYRAKENSTLDPVLGDKYPMIKTYDASGTDNGAFVKWDITQHGFHAMIMIPGESTIFIDPVIKGNDDYYIVYRKKDFLTDKIKDCSFNSDAEELKSGNGSGTVKSFGSCDLRTYRLALAATGEYTTFHGGTVAAAQAAQATTMNRVNGVYERDMAVTMVIIANNDQLIYTNSATDPYTNGNPGTMINQNQTNVTNVIGSANYDIGHVFGTNSGGLAGLGVVCNNSQKARGVTGSAAPIGDAFDIDYVAHEMGHEFGCNHTFNGDAGSCGGGNRNDPTAMEPGSGSTIMAYAGICTGMNVQSNSDDHFHGISLEEMGSFILGSGGTCAVTTSLTNSAPVVISTNGNVTVPANTSFALTAVATDADGDPLTYNWEQMDNQISTQPPVATSTGGPNFRSIPSLTSPTRYFPDLAGSYPGWEVTPSVSRTMNFRVTVRDNSSGAGGCNDHMDVTLTTDAGSGPFIVLYPSATGIVWTGATSETVTWDVANTDQAPVACANVDILLSVDGGLTFPYTLASNVPNDGSELITVPNVPTTTAQVMVICSNGTFFDVSDNNFEIVESTYDYTLTTTPSTIIVCQPNDATFTVDVGSIGGYIDPVSLSVSGVPAGATSSFSVNPVTPAGTSDLVITNTGSAAPGDYTLTITGNSTTGTKTNIVTLSISGGAPSAVTQISPANGATGVAVPTSFSWTTASGSGITYDIEIATDAGFTSIIDQATGLTSASYISSALSPNSTYYWRVRSVSGCGTASWSSGWSFTTDGCSSYDATDVPVAISASGTPVITSTINVPIGGTINDVNILNLTGTHTWINDLIIEVTSPLGTTVTLFSQICNNEDNFDLNFDDAAASSIIPCPPTGGGTYQPNGLLSDFNGENAAGTWTLTVYDMANQDGGSLDSWTLQVCVDPVACNNPDIPTVSGLTTLCEGSSTTLSVASGNLNDATDWQWYEGSCGGTLQGSGTSISVTPTASTSYFVRGEGACVIPGGCQQIDVTVNPIYNTTDAASICTGDSYTFGTQTLTTAGTYTELFTSVGGCDSTVVLTLSVNPVYNETDAATICQGSSYTLGTQTLTTAGTYTEVFTSVDGCDSTVVLTLTVNPTYNVTDAATICDGDTYTFGTQTLTVSGSYTEVFTSVDGCDSTVVLALTVNPTYNSTENVSICQGDSYTYPDGSAGTITESHTSLLTSIDGCDSIIVTNLTVNDPGSMVTLLTPADASTGVGMPVSFTWTAAPESGVTYDIEIATDAAFSTIVDQATGLGTNSYSSGALNTNTTYYWHVNAVTSCGASGFTSEFSFTTTSCVTYVSSDVPVNIPTGTGTYTSTINVPVGGTINDVNVIDLIGTHGAVGNLIFTLQSPSGTQVILMDQACGNNNDFDIDFDDEAASPTFPCPPIDGNAYQPNGLLSDFDGEDQQGTWTLLIQDVSNPNSGTLTAWSLELCTDPVVPCTDPDLPVVAGPSVICEGDVVTLSVTSGNLNDATDWQWYEGSCGGTLVGTGAAIAVNPTVSTSYFVRGEGGCVTPGSCTQYDVTVNPIYNTTDAASICQGDSYTFGTQTLTTAGTYTELFTSVGGCDSTVVLTLTVNPTYNTTDAATICQGSSYTFGTQTLTTAGTYAEVFTSVDGCDSTVVLTLNVNPTYNTTDAATICQGDTYTFGTQTLTTAGTYTEVFTSVDGCDSTVALTLNVNPTYNATDAATICQGDSYTFGTQTLTTAGTYTEVFTTVDGCDSTVVLTLNVNPVYNTTDAATICNGDSYTFGTQTLTTAGTYTEVFTSVGGCDSTVVLTLDVIAAYNTTDAVSICLGDSYTFGTQTLTTAGTYTELFTSAGGCDSTVTLTLTVNPTYNTTDAATICQGDTYTFGTQTLTTAGTYTEVFPSVDGCDSIVELTLTVNPTYNTTDAATICQGDSYTFGTQTLTTSGTYTEVFTSVDGCDSTVVLTLNVNPVYNTTDAATICNGDSYTFGTQTLTTAGTYTEVFTSVGGCDSTVVLTLDVIAAYNTTDATTICQGESYIFGTQTLTAAGTYTELFTSVGGCDSTVTLTLTVNPTYNTTDAATICQGDTYTFGTQPLTAAGTYTEVFSSVDGCDSTVVLTLNVNPVYNTTDAATICQGNTYTFGTQTLTTAGTYTEVFSSVDGCDSTVVLTLNVNPTFNTTDAATICQGNTYTFGTQTLTTAGTYTEVFTSGGGCDSTVVLTLDVISAYNTTDAVTICQGDSYTFGSQTLTTAGTYTELFTSVGGCDSTVTLTLTVNPTYNTTDAATICQGDSYSFGTQTLTAAGTYTEVFTSVSGCDSTVVLTLNVNPSYNTTDAATICQGDSYTFGTQTLTTSGTYTEVFTAVGGCDSTVVLDLTVTPGYDVTDFVEICQGDSYQFGSMTLTSGGTYSQTFTSVGGCDSTVTLTLNVLPSYTTTESVEICEGDSYTFPDGSIGTVTEAHTSILTGVNGCDSTVVTALTVNPSYTLNESVTICPGETYTFPDGTTGSTDQTYTSTLTTVNGCDSIITTALTVQVIDNSVSFTNGKTLTANQTGATYQWIDCDNNNTPIAGEVNQSFTATATVGNYAVIVTVGNCSDTSDCYLVDLTGIEEFGEDQISIFPNPATKELNVTWTSDVQRIEITDAKGKLVARFNVEDVQSKKVDLTSYSQGVYFIHVFTEDGRYVYDIVKQ